MMYVTVWADLKPKMCHMVCCCDYGWTLWCLITVCLCRSWCVCMFTLSADDGICAECRPAESLLRQRQAGGQMQERELLVVVQLWPWRRLWRTSVCQSTAGGEQGETQIGRDGARQRWRPSSACTGNGPMRSKPYGSFRDSWVCFCYQGSDVIRSVAGSWTWLVL